MKMNAGRKKITANGLVRRGLLHEGFCYHGRSFCFTKNYKLQT